MQANWYVARLKGGKERIAITSLKDQGFESYYPLMSVTRILHGGRVIDATEPVFPRYLFLQSQPHAACWRAINTTRGVVKLLGNACPCTVPEREIESLMQREISLPIKERIYQAAFVFLVLFAVTVIYNDIVKTLPGLARMP